MVLANRGTGTPTTVANSGNGSTSTVPVTVLGERFSQPTPPAGGDGDFANTGV